MNAALQLERNSAINKAKIVSFIGKSAF